MLKLTRKTNETLIIFLPDGREIEIMVTDLSGKTTGIGITAPNDIKILRSELIDP